MDIMNMIMILLTVQLSHWRCFGVDAQSCMDTVNVQQQGMDRLGRNSFVIVPRGNFSCNGRITGYMASMDRNADFPCYYLRVFVWQPMNTAQTIFSIRNTYVLNNSYINSMGNYYFANVSFTGNERIEFQSGDVIGYWHRSSLVLRPCYRVWNIRTAGYTSYRVGATRDNPFIDTININDGSSAAITDRQPLIQVTFDIQCSNLTTPANGEILSCSSGRVGVGYEGDICNFTCNTGYELTGSDTRTCQSDGSWSGSDDVCRRDTAGSQNEGDDSDSNTAAAVAGTIVPLIVIIILVICLVLLLLWYRKRRERKHINGLESSKLSKDKVLKYNKTAENVIYESNGGTIKNVMHDNPSYYSSADICDSSHTLNNANPVPYLNPMKAESTANDYEVYQTLNVYEQPEISEVYSSTRLSNNYEMADSSAFSGEYNTLPSGEELSNDEPIYEDPGHIKESIYEWLEQKGLSKVDKKNVRTLQMLGSGEFGVVHLALWSNGSTDPVKVAVKTLNSQCSELDRVKFLREAAIMGQFVHNNVVQLHGVVTEEENMMIVLEYMPKGDLRNYLLNIKSPELQSKDMNSSLQYDLLSYCRQIASGMNYLTTKCFVHRDLAARNILLSSEKVCKIADFGMARDVTDDTYYVTSGGKIPLKWTAPEAIFFKKYSIQSDVWSFGCVMYEIWSLGHKPFEDLDGKEYINKITTGYRLPPPPGCLRAIYELMIQCWHPEAKGRPYSKLILRTLEKSDEILLQWSGSTNTDDHLTVLGAPLINGEQLYPDLQSQYKTT